MVESPAKRQKSKQHKEPSPSHEVASLVLVVAAIGGLVYSFIRSQKLMHHAETALIVDVETTTTTQTDLCGPPTKDGRPVVISMLYSSDKQPWVELGANRFARLCPNIQVKLIHMGDIESADAILAGQEVPTLWAPADDLVLRYLDVRWRAEKGNGRPLFDITQPVSLVQSPLVVLIWEDRLQVVNSVMAARSGERDQGFWASAMCAQVPSDPSLTGMVIGDMVPGQWIDWYNPVLPAPSKRPALVPPKPGAPKLESSAPAYHAPFPTLEQLRSWGRVKLGHTSPTRSAAGLEALYLMAFEHLLPLKDRAPAASQKPLIDTSEPSSGGRVIANEALRDDFQRAFAERKSSLLTWLKRCEAGLDAAPKSAQELTDTMFNVGASRYDAVLTYEHLTFQVFKSIDAFTNVMHDMRIIYPQPTIMNQHPVVVLQGSKEPTEAEKLSAAKWIAFLRTKQMQESAIEHGFRPSNPDISIRNYESQTNLFMSFRRYGVTFDDPIVEPPRLNGETVYELIRIWQDATGRN